MDHRHTLLFRPRSETLEPAAFDAYFASVDGHSPILASLLYRGKNVKEYRNNDTGVLLNFQLIETNLPKGTREQYVVCMSMEYFVPTYFTIEAEPVVTALVKHFDLLVLVYDPQSQEVVEEEYSAGYLRKSWEEAHTAIYGRSLQRTGVSPQGLHLLPEDVLFKNWEWNYRRLDLQLELGNGVYVPRIQYLALDGKPGTAALWKDGNAIAVPEVDYFLVADSDLDPDAPDGFMKNRTIVSAEKVLPLFHKHRAINRPGFVLNYKDRPPDVLEFIRRLPPTKHSVTELEPFEITEQELVQRLLDGRS